MRFRSIKQKVRLCGVFELKYKIVDLGGFGPVRTVRTFFRQKQRKYARHSLAREKPKTMEIQQKLEPGHLPEVDL